MRSMVRLKGFEPPTFWFVAKHSIQLSYSRMSTGESSLADSLIILTQVETECKRKFQISSKNFLPLGGGLDAHPIQAAHQVVYRLQADVRPEHLLPQAGGHSVQPGPERRVHIGHVITSHIRLLYRIARNRGNDTPGIKKRAPETETRNFWSVPTAGSDCCPAAGQWVVH